MKIVMVKVSILSGHKNRNNLAFNRFQNDLNAASDEQQHTTRSGICLTEMMPTRRSSTVEKTPHEPPLEAIS